MALASQAAMLQNDAFLLFRALCKLSMKPLPHGTPSQDQPVALKSKNPLLRTFVVYFGKLRAYISIIETVC
eukprot:TRINITY_DN9437_c0_g1_i1.p2 TRINITY_DN9437_c0_g1~~TRINITY_DN9437_c0_g1_i1.p2  ORF type:complete len:71 (+),score=10.44 TRINITY_DN9437_c0_g1_i1:40-252(+)